MVSGGFSKRMGKINQSETSSEDLNQTQHSSIRTNQTGKGAGDPLRVRPDLSNYRSKADPESPHVQNMGQDVFEKALNSEEFNFDSQCLTSICLEQADIKSLSFVESELINFVIRDASVPNANFANASCRGLNVD